MGKRLSVTESTHMAMRISNTNNEMKMSQTIHGFTGELNAKTE